VESKFNFSDDENLNEDSYNKEFQTNNWLKNSYRFFKEILDFKAQTDRDSTINSIKEDISIKGATAWILICSIFVASVGLNANSIPVVIGAMLISPLMGPILGFGMSIAINDIETLKKSLINFIVMVSLSILTAYLFFAFFPLREESSELLSRTQPDIRDVLIAFFGGLALIIAKTKKGTISSVIFGVAIATALMPPLCTVGFGLATGNSVFVIGAMYLFIINTLYITLATYLVIKLLRFPMLNYANSKKRTLIGRVIAFFSILMIIPALYTFLDVLNESKFNSSAKEFLKTELKDIKNKDYLIETAKYRYNISTNSSESIWPWRDRESEIIISNFSDNNIEIEFLKNISTKIEKYSNLSKTTIIFTEKNEIEQAKFLLELRYRDSLELIEKNKRIDFLQNKLMVLQSTEKINLVIESLSTEIDIHFEEIDSFYFKYDGDFVDDIPKLYIKWSNALEDYIITKRQMKLKEWLDFKFEETSFEIINL
tara:strand:+ start:10933 stop:12390 length:1458 start_codon:yes stop_codon:yes gene_type:complete